MMSPSVNTKSQPKSEYVNIVVMQKCDFFDIKRFASQGWG